MEASNDKHQHPPPSSPPVSLLIHTEGGKFEFFPNNFFTQDFPFASSEKKTAPQFQFKICIYIYILSIQVSLIFFSIYRIFII